MQRITLRVLDGADRGRVFTNLEPPVTIGREEGNTIQLNDERVSRFHAKIQVDHDNVVLTDLESTNGTRVNGEDVQLRNLRFGDLIHVGRTSLVFGTRDEIADRLRRLCRPGQEDARRKSGIESKDLELSDSDVPWREKEDIQEMFFGLEPPDLPERLSPGQAAQLSEIIEYLLITIRHLIESVRERDDEHVTLTLCQWENLLDLQCRLAEYLRRIGEPDSDAM